MCNSEFKHNILTKKQRINAFVALGDYLRAEDGSLHGLVLSAAHHNPWFTAPNVRKALNSIALNLSESKLNEWLAPYPFDMEIDRTVGLVLAGNVPLVGFHDILCALCAGFSIQVKPSANDALLTKYLLDSLQLIEPRFTKKIALVEQLKGFDLVIATGSDNSARYFTYYFGNKPHIIRKNRNSIAVLTGNESKEECHNLGADVFDYFGLGCRNVSKLFVPEGYEISAFFEGITVFSDIINHYKYANNYDYNKSIYLINGDTHYDNGFLLVKPDERIASPLATLYLEVYGDRDGLTNRLTALAPQLQCVVAAEELPIPTPVVGFGDSQQPALNDYADGVNTLDFLAQHR